jgi:hypothetical protein
VGRNKLHPGLLAAPERGNFQRREARQTLLVRKTSVQQPYTLSETGLHPEKAHLSVGFFFIPLIPRFLFVQREKFSSLGTIGGRDETHAAFAVLMTEAIMQTPSTDQAFATLASRPSARPDTAKLTINHS